jgi:hypothetical protein
MRANHKSGIAAVVAEQMPGVLDAYHRENNTSGSPPFQCAAHVLWLRTSRLFRQCIEDATTDQARTPINPPVVITSATSSHERVD